MLTYTKKIGGKMLLIISLRRRKVLCKQEAEVPPVVMPNSVFQIMMGIATWRLIQSSHLHSGVKAIFCWLCPEVN